MASSEAIILSGPAETARLRFVWGQPKTLPAPWQLGLFCAYNWVKSQATGQYYIPPRGTTGRFRLSIVISVRGLMCWCFALALSGYLAATGGLYTLYQKKPHNLVTYSDLALPWRWDGISALRGQALLMQGKEDFAARKFGEAYGALRAGLARYPQDAKARVQLATLKLLRGWRSQSDELLLDALNYGDPGLAYNRVAVAYIKDSDRPERVLEFVRRARGLVPDDAQRVAHLRFLATAEADVLLELQRPTEAVAVISALDPAQPELIGRIRTQARLQSDGAAAAIKEVEEWKKSQPDSEQAVAMSVSLYRQAGRLADMESSLKRLKALNPTSPSFASMGVVQNLLANRKDEARVAFDDCLIRFDSNFSILETLARDIERTGHIELLVPLEQVMREHGFDTEIVLFSRLMGQLDAADWAGAKITQQALADKIKTLSANVSSFQETAAPLIAVCSQDSAAARVVLLDRVSHHGGRLKLYVQLIDWLLLAKQWPVANDVLTLAEGAFPGSVKLANRREQLAPHLAAIKAAEDAEAEAAKRVRLASGVDLFPHADAFFKSLEKERAAATPQTALRLIQTLRRSEPAWLPSAAEKVDGIEVDLVLELGDLLQLQSVVRTYLRLDRADRSQRICTLAKQRHADGFSALAELLVREVLRRKPDDRTALDLLKAWAPPVSPLPADESATLGDEFMTPAPRATP